MPQNKPQARVQFLPSIKTISKDIATVQHLFDQNAAIIYVEGFIYIIVVDDEI